MYQLQRGHGEFRGSGGTFGKGPLGREHPNGTVYRMSLKTLAVAIGPGNLALVVVAPLLFVVGMVSFVLLWLF